MSSYNSFFLWCHSFQTLWMTACHVFIDEISRVRTLLNTWPPGTPQVNEEELMEKLRDGITALSLFSEDSALMSMYWAFGTPSPESPQAADNLLPLQNINSRRYKKPSSPSEFEDRLWTRLPDTRLPFDTYYTRYHYDFASILLLLFSICSTSCIHLIITVISY